MKTTKIVFQIEKTLDKFESMEFKSENSEREADFEAIRGDVISLLNDMAEIAHTEIEEGQDENEE